jgi:hypothetical protein
LFSTEFSIRKMLSARGLSISNELASVGRRSALHG